MNTSTFSTNAFDIEGHNPRYEFIGLPEQCPECQKGQKFPEPYIVRKYMDHLCIGVFQCMFSDCRAVFLGLYQRRSDGGYIYLNNDIPRYSEPNETIPEIIDSISSNYRKIYAQAEKAEQQGLDLIAGSGYRKALEFLIKDYAIKLVADDTEESKYTNEQISTIQSIKKNQLASVINANINIPKVKSMASRATWLGNDETHYERRFEQSDITVMKTLMKLTILHIEAEELTKQYEKDIQPTK
ncbi:MAG: hypothetical protein Q8L37_05520 [Candidatus Gottesmanbacteria bacterium]|nr:hypothetical protein [Candidatus Gottesmanbacteria bacterium]